MQPIMFSIFGPDIKQRSHPQLLHVFSINEIVGKLSLKEHYPILEPFFPTRILRWLILCVIKCCSILREPSRNSFQSIRRCSMPYGISYINKLAGHFHAYLCLPAGQRKHILLSVQTRQWNT